jgi:hypothetical protein
MQFIQHVNLYWLVFELLAGLAVIALVWRYFDVILAWLKSKNWTTHTVGAACISAAIYISASQQAQQFLLDLLKAHPALAADAILLATLIAKASRSSSPAGTMAAARAIRADGDQPTTKQVDEADTAITK